MSVIAKKSVEALPSLAEPLAAFTSAVNAPPLGVAGNRYFGAMQLNIANAVSLSGVSESDDEEEDWEDDEPEEEDKEDDEDGDRLGDDDPTEGDQDGESGSDEDSDEDEGDGG